MAATAGGEFGIRGFIAAHDVQTGKEAWRFNTVPLPGEPGHETWGGDGWKNGGGSIWVTGSYDPETNLTFWGVGNPGPDYNAKTRPGDNLYTCSVVAIDPDTGKLKWHYQFTPGDEFDWDAVQIPVLADILNVYPSNCESPPAVQNQRNPRESLTMRWTSLWTRPSAVV